MLFRRKPKIVKKGKVYPYGRRTANVETSIFDGMSLIEQLTMIILPCCMVFMFYFMLEMFGISIWWIKLISAIGIVALLFSLIYWIVSWITERSL